MFYWYFMDQIKVVIWSIVLFWSNNIITSETIFLHQIKFTFWMRQMNEWWIHFVLFFQNNFFVNLFKFLKGCTLSLSIYSVWEENFIWQNKKQLKHYLHAFEIKPFLVTRKKINYFIFLLVGQNLNFFKCWETFFIPSVLCIINVLNSNELPD